MVSLNQLLDEIETTPVSIGFLKKVVGEDVRVLHYKELRKYSRSALFKGKKAVICLIPHRKLKKGHFVCLVPEAKGISYFSSLGMSPEQELTKLGDEPTLMSELLGKTFTYNRVKLQNSSSYSVNTCGAFVFARAKLSRMKNREFVDIFKRQLVAQSPDDIVSALVLLSFAS